MSPGGLSNKLPGFPRGPESPGVFRDSSRFILKLIVVTDYFQRPPHSLGCPWPQPFPKILSVTGFTVAKGYRQEDGGGTGGESDLGSTWSSFLYRVNVKTTAFLIADALPDTNYTVKVRAIEEFYHGTWSRWSKQAYGMPWADPQRNIIPEDNTEGLPSGPIDPEDINWEASTPQGSHHPEWSNFPWYRPLLVAVSLFIVIMLFIIIVIRYRKKWKGQATAKVKGKNRPEYLSIRLITASEVKESEASAESAIQQSSEAPAPESQSLTSDEQPHFDVINVSYFYIP
ncbi:interleukin-6 receptor subunit alpha-like [Carcharodon carcharias]|uniref:interleukin-6 receptor subunit alpha-like n=1 Tax=Carcharodon carcharias TaxID=13397 RepID=UPI001B7DDFBA|nr:interleukin-6 receptor subunit alpha-like [Carcharodon carcharias]